MDLEGKIVNITADLDEINSSVIDVRAFADPKN
jgi:hypothetical protein